MARNPAPHRGRKSKRSTSSGGDKWAGYRGRRVSKLSALSTKGSAPEQHLSLGPSFHRQAVQSPATGCSAWSWLSLEACMAPPGPSRLEVEAIVAGAMQPVILNVYELGHAALIAGINKVTKGLLSQGGVFHVAVEVTGREVSYGSTSRDTSGIFACYPRRCALHRYRESVYLGDCHMTSEEVRSLLRVLRPEWRGREYSTLHRNCGHFAAELARCLGVGELPRWVHHLADVAARVDLATSSVFHVLEDAGLVAASEPEDVS